MVLIYCLLIFISGTLLTTRYLAFVAKKNFFEIIKHPGKYNFEAVKNAIDNITLKPSWLVPTIYYTYRQKIYFILAQKAEVIYSKMYSENKGVKIQEEYNPLKYYQETVRLSKYGTHSVTLEAKRRIEDFRRRYYTT